ncbi:DUF4003 family protein [Metabacillus sp. 113a]|uniref:DUF4003 family protein n=1 Tax=Metabacillus sp. 113a TaxID=3404706 RepID=UPI003CF9BEA5
METIQHKLYLYKEIYLSLKEELKWKAADQRVIMMAASLYAVSGKPFHLPSYLNICDYMKQYSGLFSPFKSYHRFITAAMLDVRYEDPFAKFEEMNHVHDLLAEAGFRKGIFTYIAALAIMGTAADSPVSLEKASKAYSIYSRMKEKHFFLTSASDYPLAALLSHKEEAVNELVERMETYYDELNRQGFKKGNDLQFLSHILSLDEKSNFHSLLSRCTQSARELEQLGFTIKKKHYPEIGLLSLAGESSRDLAILAETVDQLNSDREFKWYKNMNFTAATHLSVSGCIQQASVLGTGLYTSMEIVLQAQQAIMIAAIAGSVSSSSDGGGE